MVRTWFSYQPLLFLYQPQSTAVKKRLHVHFTLCLTFVQSVCRDLLLDVVINYFPLETTMWINTCDRERSSLSRLVWVEDGQRFSTWGSWPLEGPEKGGSFVFFLFESKHLGRGPCCVCTANSYAQFGKLKCCGNNGQRNN